MVEVLLALLNPHVVVDFDGSAGTVTLKENAAGSTFSPTVLYGLDKTNTIVFRLDEPRTAQQDFTKKSAYLHPSTGGIHQGCDYVVVTHFNGRHVALFCECKSSAIAGGKAQLRHSRPFWDYLVRLASTHFGVDLSQVDLRYVLLSTTKRFNKTYTKQKVRIDSYRDIRVKLPGNPDRLWIQKLL